MDKKCDTIACECTVNIEHNQKTKYRRTSSESNQSDFCVYGFIAVLTIIILAGGLFCLFHFLYGHPECPKLKPKPNDPIPKPDYPAAPVFPNPPDCVPVPPKSGVKPANPNSTNALPNPSIPTSGCKKSNCSNSDREKT